MLQNQQLSNIQPPSFPTHQARGHLPRSVWQVDFTNMPAVKHTRCLLVFIDTLTGWIEAFPTTNKRACTVTTILFREIIPPFGLSASLQSDNAPEFTSSIVQKLIAYMGSKWHFHVPCHPQSSGKVEKANHTLKTTLTKLSQELQMDWIKRLPLVLLRTQAVPLNPLLISPFEAMYGRPLVTLGLPTSPSNIPPPLLSSLLPYTRTTLWAHLDTNSQNPPLLLLQTLTWFRLGNGFITRDQNPLSPFNLLDGPLWVIFTTPHCG
jgi:transposase InsO family protein